MTDDRLNSAAAERNRGPILGELQRLLAERGRLLEIAAGTGQHAVHFAAGLPGWTWQSTDRDPRSLASIRAWAVDARLPNLLPPLTLDVMQQPWPVDGLFDAVFNANMIHIAPWACCTALMRGAAAVLRPGGSLITYGPYFIDGETPAPGNVAFDADLRARDPAWGVRLLSAVVAEAEAAGLALTRQVAMPANNRLLVFHLT
jgi:SAM-dependent methyltransferase